MADTGGHVVQLHLTLCVSVTCSTSQKGELQDNLKKHTCQNTGWAYDQKETSTNQLHCNTASPQMCCSQILLWTSKCSLSEGMHEWVSLFFSFFGLKCNERSGIWPSVNKAFHSLGYFLFFFPAFFSLLDSDTFLGAHAEVQHGWKDGGRTMDVQYTSVNHPVAAFSLPPTQSVPTLVQVNAGQLNNTHALCEYLKLY